MAEFVFAAGGDGLRCSTLGHDPTVPLDHPQSHAPISSAPGLRYCQIVVLRLPAGCALTVRPVAKDQR